MKYNIEFSKQAIKDIQQLRRDEPSVYKKLAKLIEELEVHPTTGTGKPERLKGDRSGQWSREISKKHRIVYTIEDEILIVYVLTSKGHYDDK